MLVSLVQDTLRVCSVIHSCMRIVQPQPATCLCHLQAHARTAGRNNAWQHHQQNQTVSRRRPPQTKQYLQMTGTK